MFLFRVFVGSFSKIMGPGLRLGYFAVKTSASEMRGKIQANRMDGGTSGLASMIVGEFAKEHLWEHIAVVNHVFSEKLRTLDESVMKGNRVILKEDDLFIVQPGQRLHIEPDESSYEVLFGGPDKWNVSHAALEFSKMLLCLLEALRGLCR